MKEPIETIKYNTLSRPGDMDMVLRCYLPELGRQLKKRNTRILIYSIRRSNDEQAALYMQGRKPLAFVNRMRAKVHLDPLSERDNGRIVTNAKDGQSPHEWGLAFDCVPLGKGDKPLWAYGKHWSLLAEAVEESGLTWGGYFRGGTKEKPTDGPHVEVFNWKRYARGYSQ